MRSCRLQGFWRQFIIQKRITDQTGLGNKSKTENMKTKFSALVLVISFSLMAGCTTAKRYSSLTSPISENRLAAIDLFGFRLTDSKPPQSAMSLWDMGAEAQSQYIRILNTRYPDNRRFREAVNFRYSDDLHEAVPDDYINKDLRLIFSVSRSHDYYNPGQSGGITVTPADRIEYLKISLELPERSPLRFTGWNMYSTEYGSIEIADISFSRSIEIDAATGLTAGNDNSEGKLTAGGKSSLSRKEDQSLKYRYLKLNGSLDNKLIQMEEEGTREIDLTGNIIADVSVSFDRFPGVVTVMTGLNDSTGKYSMPEKVTIQFDDVMVPLMRDIEDTIYAELSMDYLYRNVVRGDKTFPEWDDRIRYIRGSVKAMVPVLTASDYVPGFFCIGSAGKDDKREVLRLASEGSSYPLIFRSYGEALSFHKWLIWYFGKQDFPEKGVNPGGYVLRYRGSDLTGKIFLSDSSIRLLPYYMQDF